MGAAVSDERFALVLATLIMLGGAFVIVMLQRDWAAKQEREGCSKVTRYGQLLEDSYVCPPSDAGAR